jgi:hypothetical protein
VKGKFGLKMDVYSSDEDAELGLLAPEGRAKRVVR